MSLLDSLADKRYVKVDVARQKVLAMGRYTNEVFIYDANGSELGRYEYSAARYDPALDILDQLIKSGEYLEAIQPPRIPTKVIMDGYGLGFTVTGYAEVQDNNSFPHYKTLRIGDKLFADYVYEYMELDRNEEGVYALGNVRISLEILPII